MHPQCATDAECKVTHFSLYSPCVTDFFLVSLAIHPFQGKRHCCQRGHEAYSRKRGMEVNLLFREQYLTLRERY